MLVSSVPCKACSSCLLAASSRFNVSSTSACSWDCGQEKGHPEPVPVGAHPLPSPRPSECEQGPDPRPSTLSTHLALGLLAHPLEGILQLLLLPLHITLGLPRRRHLLGHLCVLRTPVGSQQPSRPGLCSQQPAADPPFSAGRRGSAPARCTSPSACCTAAHSPALSLPCTGPGELWVHPLAHRCPP